MVRATATALHGDINDSELRRDTSILASGIGYQLIEVHGVRCGSVRSPPRCQDDEVVREIEIVNDCRTRFEAKAVIPKTTSTSAAKPRSDRRSRGAGSERRNHG